MSRAFHLGERARALDEAAVAYLVALEAEGQHPSWRAQQGIARRRLLAAALTFARAKRSNAAKNATTRLSICPGCNLPLETPTYGRPRKYHSNRCYNLARRLER